MGFDFIKKLPTPEEIRNQYPIDAEIQAVKDARDKELRDVFTGKSDYNGSLFPMFWDSRIAA